MASYILAIDQGTTGSTALVVGSDGAVVARANCEFPQHFPHPGWVEHDPEELWSSVETAVSRALNASPVAAGDIFCIGITNQRETTLLWDRRTGKPLHRAIVWQDRRTAADCERLKREGREAMVRRETGLLLDPYFSGPKLAWLLRRVPGADSSARRGQLCFGTVDSYLLWRLTGGKDGGVHLTDASNASRTLLMDLRSVTWSPRMCEMLDVPEAVLPEIRPSAGVFGRTRGFAPLPDGIPISAMAGDQHAALFGQGCLRRGQLKCTYGTGAFVLANTGDQPVYDSSGLLSTVAWQIGGKTTYALEGSCFVAGAAVQWLRDGLGIIEKSSDVEALARQVSGSEGVAFVPALVGLGAPYWRPDARGLICGLSRGSTGAHIARATLEAIAFQVDDLLRLIGRSLEQQLDTLWVDGGAAANNLLLELQANLSGVRVQRPQELETTAVGAAMLAGLGAELFETPAQAQQMIRLDRQFDASITDEERRLARTGWEAAVRRTLSEAQSELP